MANRLTAEDFTSTNNQYIYLPYHWTKELVKGGHIKVPYVQTKINVADLMTKSVDGHTIINLRNKLTGYDTEWLWQLLEDQTPPDIKEVITCWASWLWPQEDAIAYHKWRLGG